MVISDPVPCTFTISPTSNSIPAAGASNQQINVSTQNGCAWTAESNAGWLTVTGGATGSGSGTVTYSAVANSGAQRTGTITVAGQTFTVTQAAASTANSYVVTNTNSSGAGSLRQAILDANATTADDTIIFDISGCPSGVCTITLTSGELVIDAVSTAGKLTITNSTGAGKLLISGNNSSRVFFVRKNANVILDGITVTGGNGMGINSNSFPNSGGGICIDGFGAVLTLINSTVRANSVQLGVGGGIYNFAGALTLINSTINNNSSGEGGGGVFTNGGKLTIANSTISGNTATGYYTAGGIDFTGGNTADLTNVTITNNRLTTTDCTTCGGGIWNGDGGFVINLRNTIVAGNTVANTSSSPDIQGLVSTSSSFNIIGNNLGTTGITNGNNNQVGTNTNPIDARLAPLGNYGGTTQTHTLLSNSPAIDAGNDCVTNLTCSSNNPPAALTTDQRGAGFPRKVGSAVDIGAVEFAAQNVVINNGQILFVSRRDGNDEIYKMNADGSNQQRLTNSPEAESNGKWSPDNQKILYSKSINSMTNQIWTMNADGSNQTIISDAAGYNSPYGWSPNGQKILFTKGSSINGSDTRIWTMNADGSNKVQLTNTSMIDHIPSWSPDGGKIAFGRCDTSFVCDIFTMNADGSNQTNLTPDNPNDDDAPKWTPNGSKIVFGRQTSADNGDYNVYVMNADGTNKQSLTNDPVQTYSPSAVSPNGNLVAMYTRPDGIHTDIVTIGIDGSNLTNLTNNSDYDNFGAWSPDNTKIVFTRGLGSATYEIYVMNADGSSVVRLTNNSVYDLVTDWQAIPSYTTSTPAGQNISVTPTNNLNLNFSNITTAGNTVATVIPPDQLQPLPSGFGLLSSDLIYDITTSASFSGNITVTFAVPNVADAAACANLRSLHYVNGAWTTDTNATPVYNAGTQICTVAQTVTSLSPFAVAKILAPSAAAVNVGGRTTTANGGGIANVRITMTDASGNNRTALTNSFGYYRFSDVTAGATYIITAQSKRFTFSQPVQVVNIVEDTDDIDFTENSNTFR